MESLCGAWGAASGAISPAASPQLLQPSTAGAPQPQGAAPQLEQLLHSVLQEQVEQQPARRALRASRRDMHSQLHWLTSQPQGAAAEQPQGAGAASHGQAGASQQTGAASQHTGWQQAGLQHLFFRLNKPASTLEASMAAKPAITTITAVNTIIVRFIM